MDKKPPFILAIDAGTSSVRAILFDASAGIAASHARSIGATYPANGWVEQDPEEIWRACLECARTVLAGRTDVAAIGITNQRETTLLWDRATGRALHNAIVWQDRRTAARCRALKAQKWEPRIARRTGLLLDPYFSATKLEWLLGHVKGARMRAAKGELAFGTVDSWLIYKLTGGKVHATDVSNASRTMLLDLKTLEWDGELLKLFGVSGKLLPQVRDSIGGFGASDPSLFGRAIPIKGVAGDQQAAAFGHACFAPGDIKATYGTGCFMLVNTGAKIARSKKRLLSTALFRGAGQKAYALEGSIFVAGAVVQWLRDELRLIGTAAESETLARAAREVRGLYFVPAFTGLGAPYWDPNARGAIFGLTRDVGKAELVRAALDAVCFETRDLIEAMAADLKSAGLRAPRILKVDGGMVANDWFCQRLADLAGLRVERPRVTETTALGAAYLAGLSAGIFKDTKEIAAHWALDRAFAPAMKKTMRDALYRGWQDAVRKSRAAPAP